MRHHRGGDRRVILRGVTYTDRLGEGVDLLEMVCDASCLMKQENGLSIGLRPSAVREELARPDGGLLILRVGYGVIRYEADLSGRPDKRLWHIARSLARPHHPQGLRAMGGQSCNAFRTAANTISWPCAFQ